jgi:hypothetical protein
LLKLASWNWVDVTKVHSTVNGHFRIRMQIGPQKVAQESWFWNGSGEIQKRQLGNSTLLYSWANSVLTDVTATETVFSLEPQKPRHILISIDMITSVPSLFIKWYKLIDPYDWGKMSSDYTYTNFSSSILHWLAPRLIAWFDYCE